MNVDRDWIDANLEFAISQNNKKLQVDYIKKSGKQYFKFSPEQTGDYILSLAIRDGKKEYEKDQTFFIDNFTIIDNSNRNLDLTANNITFVPQVLSYNDYYPFGMLVPQRNYSSPSYRYGFQGQEKDDEIKGSGNSLNYKFRMQDPRVGWFFAVDPLAAQYPWYTPYQFSGNKVIAFVELEGAEEKENNLIAAKFLSIEA